MSKYVDSIKEVLLNELEDLKAKAEWLRNVCDEETAICDEKIDILNRELNVIKEEINNVDRKYTRRMVYFVPVAVLISGLFLILFSKIFTLLGMELAFSIVISLLATCVSILPFFALYLISQCNKHSYFTAFYNLEKYELNLKINQCQLRKLKAKNNYDAACKLVTAKENEINNLNNSVSSRNDYNGCADVINNKPMMRKLVRDDD